MYHFILTLHSMTQRPNSPEPNLSSHPLNVPIYIPPPSNNNTNNKTAIMEIVKNDPEFRKELRTMIAEALKTELQRLRTDLLGITDTSYNLNDILQKEFAGCQITKWNYFDEKGSVYGFAETIDVDVIKRGNDTFLCNIKEV